MKGILGNFLTQANNDFPVDCETYQYLQNNSALTAILGNIAGDKVVISGCEIEQDGTRRKPGYVFLRTKDFPKGEVIYWEGGGTSGMYLKTSTISVSREGYVYPKAYTERSLADGIGIENYSWDDFTDIKTIKELQEQNTSLQAQISLIVPPPVGIVQMWAGHATIGSLPDDYALCDGSPLLISNYPKLYAVIGRLHTPSSVPAEYFCLPNLKGQFVVGYDPDDSEYDNIAKKGGEKKHTLDADEMPEHKHEFKNYYCVESVQAGVDGNDYYGSSLKGSGKTDWDNHYFWYRNCDTKEAGAGKSHENRPPFYTLAYIIRTK